MPLIGGLLARGRTRLGFPAPCPEVAAAASTIVMGDELMVSIDLCNEHRSKAYWEMHAGDDGRSEYCPPSLWPRLGCDQRVLKMNRNACQMRQNVRHFNRGTYQGCCLRHRHGC